MVSVNERKSKYGRVPKTKILLRMISPFTVHQFNIVLCELKMRYDISPVWYVTLKLGQW